ncbi:acyltransferase family protein [Luteipulveratus mongoliensis]|uniref:Acyltransferase 3 domain-containing protein n=1 Tax=Luteipulveratus mongoliensis TaxID=571913 RepID=A0A0K1JIY4_9MICO|nr:acyltransferase [Luteipulveratus mongoliensis]AKU16666.1 hypothetical protein VV02_13650 [Luteipulveratus mongoliensis]
MSDARRMVSLDGMRGAIVLAVIAFHAWQYAGGQARSGQHDPYSLAIRGASWAVAWFFVATGALLYRSYSTRVLEDRETGPAHRFLMRRLLRVLPAYWVAVVVVWAARNPKLPGDWVDLVEHLTLTHVFDPQRIFWTIGPAWSLPSQILHYVVIALLWVPLARWCSGRSRTARTVALAAPCVALILIGLVYSVWLSLASGIDRGDWPILFSPAAQAPALGGGMLLGLVLARWKPQLRRVGSTLLAGAAVALLAALIGWEASHGSGHADVLGFRALSTATAIVFIASVMATQPNLWWNRAWGLEPLAMVGRISFSVYLWHEPSLLLMSALGVITPSDSVAHVTVVLLISGLVSGVLAYQAIEKPLANLTELVAPRVPFRDRYRAAHRSAEPELATVTSSSA